MRKWLVIAAAILFLPTSAFAQCGGFSLTSCVPPPFTVGDFTVVGPGGAIRDASGSGAPPTNLSSIGLGAGLWSAAVNAPGSGYVPGDSYTPSITGATTNSILGANYVGASLVVASTQVVSATVAAGGGSCTNGTQTVTGTTGTGAGTQFFQASVTVAGNAITAVISITRPGVYQVNPTSLTNEPVTGAGCAGSQLNVVMGALYVNVRNPGSYSAIGANPSPATQSASSGSGTGLTLNITFAAQSAYVLPPSNSNNVTGGSQASTSSCMGYLCMASVTTGVEMTCFGWNCLNATTTGQFITSFGINALGSNTTGGNLAAFGRDAGRNHLTGIQNSYFGDAAGQGAGGGSSDVGSAAFGTNALTAISSGINNTAIGSLAGAAITVSPSNTVVGNQAGNAINTGNGQNVAVGLKAGFTLTTAQQNTIIGSQVASTTLQTGSNNVLIGTGTNIDTAAGGTSNTIQIGAGSTAVWSATGTGTPSTSVSTVAGTLTVAGIQSAAQADVVCTTSAGLLTFQVSATGCASSSIRFKEGLKSIADADALAIITKLEPKSYYYRPETDMGADIHFGFTAEQVEKVDSKLITYEDDGTPHAVKYNELHAFYAGAFRQLKADNDNLNSCMESWKCRIFGWR